MADVAERRKFFARLMAAASGWNDPRFGQAIEDVPREDFMGPGPWRVYVIGGGYVETPSSDPGYLYQDALVALDAEQGINNGQPTLHARWIGAVKPRPGEIVTHVGAGTGYYTAHSGENSLSPAAMSMPTRSISLSQRRRGAIWRPMTT